MYSDLSLVSTSHLQERKQVPILVVGPVPCYNLKVSSPRTVSAVVRRRPADSPALSPSDFSKARVPPFFHFCLFFFSYTSPAVSVPLFRFGSNLAPKTLRGTGGASRFIATFLSNRNKMRRGPCRVPCVASSLLPSPSGRWRNVDMKAYRALCPK